MEDKAGAESTRTWTCDLLHTGFHANAKNSPCSPDAHPRLLFEALLKATTAQGPNIFFKHSLAGNVAAASFALYHRFSGSYFHSEAGPRQESPHLRSIVNTKQSAQSSYRQTNCRTNVGIISDKLLKIENLVCAVSQPLFSAKCSDSTEV